MNIIKKQTIRLLSHITFGKSKEKYKKLWYEIKNEIHDTPKYTTSAIYPLLQEQTNKIELIKSDIKKVYDNLFYQRVPGYGTPLSVYDYISSINECNILHKRAFKNKRYSNYGKDIVICATGPTLKFYTPINNAYHIGMNNAYKSQNIDFDALFCQDSFVVFDGKMPSDFITYRGPDCIKFLGNQQPLSLDVNPQNYPVFYYMSENKFNYNIDCRPLPDFTSVVFSAFAYALWTTPKRIFLVGADCSTGHSDNLNAKHKGSASHLVEHWKKMKNFACRFYPDINVISINPVGLRGLFTDVYTSEFLKNNSENQSLKNSEIILLENLV